MTFGKGLVYKDMTFCKFWQFCIDGVTCNKALTETVIKTAWGDERDPNKMIPIVSFVAPPIDCFKHNQPPQETN